MMACPAGALAKEDAEAGKNINVVIIRIKISAVLSEAEGQKMFTLNILKCHYPN